MIAIKHLLVPTDFSEPSQIAVTYGKALAENFKSTLHLIHVLDENALIYPWTSPEGTTLSLGAARVELEQQARDRLDRVLTEDERKMFSAQIVSLVGSPFLEIVNYAKAKEIDLIVLGTHGRGPIAHMLMGSVAEKVVRKAPCPVLTVRHPEHEFIMP